MSVTAATNEDIPKAPSSVRPELVQSAVNFLNDPNVEKSTLEKKVAFLEAKGLTSAEIKNAIAQSISSTSNTTPSPSIPFGENIIISPQPSSTPQLPLYPEPARTTWREYLLTSVIFGAVGYSIYGLTQSFLAPLLKWPSEADLDLERQKMDEQFEQAFQAIENMKKETQTVLNKVYHQNEVIEKTLLSLSEAIEALKDQDKTRNIDIDKLWEEMEVVKKLIPDSFTKSRDSQTSLLGDLQGEIRALKSLVGRRAGTTPISSSLTLPNSPDSFSASQASPLTPMFTEEKKELNSVSPTSTPSIPAWQKSFRSKSRNEIEEPSQPIVDNDITVSPTEIQATSPLFSNSSDPEPTTTAT